MIWLCHDCGARRENCDTRLIGYDHYEYWGAPISQAVYEPRCENCQSENVEKTDSLENLLKEETPNED